MTDILSKITNYRKMRGWTEYQLADKSGISQSTINSWYRKNLVPTIPSLEKICSAFGITLSQFFSDEEDSPALTESQKSLVSASCRLDARQLEHLISFMETL